MLLSALLILAQPNDLPKIALKAMECRPAALCVQGGPGEELEPHVARAISKLGFEVLERDAIEAMLIENGVSRAERDQLCHSEGCLTQLQDALGALGLDYLIIGRLSIRKHRAELFLTLRRQGSGSNVAKDFEEAASWEELRPKIPSLVAGVLEQILPSSKQRQKSDPNSKRKQGIEGSLRLKTMMKEHFERPYNYMDRLEITLKDARVVIENNGKYTVGLLVTLKPYRTGWIAEKSFSLFDANEALEEARWFHPITKEAKTVFIPRLGERQLERGKPTTAWITFGGLDADVKFLGVQYRPAWAGMRPYVAGLSQDMTTSVPARPVGKRLSDNSIGQLLDRAERAKMRGDLKRVVVDSKTILRVAPANAEAYVLLGWAQLQMSDFRNARRNLSEGIRLGAPAVAHYHLGVVCQMLGENREAVKNFRRFVALAPQHDNAALAHSLIGALHDVADDAGAGVQPAPAKSGGGGPVGIGDASGIHAGPGAGRISPRGPRLSVRMKKSLISLHSGEFDISKGNLRINRRRRAFQACYERELKNSLGIKGVIKLEVTVGLDGRVDAIEIQENTVKASVGQCLGSKLRMIRFPRPQGGEQVVFRIWFKFSSH